MRRVLSVWFPMFSTDLVKRRWRRSRPAAPGRGSPAIILTRVVASRDIVVRRCELAASAGVLEGMDLAHARSLLPAHVPLCVEAHRPDHDAWALRSLACWALRFSPLVAPDPPDGLLIDFTGAERLHRGEPNLLRKAHAGLRRLGFAVRLSAASTFACAWGVARFGRHDLSRVPHGKERVALDPLPVAALGLDEDAVLGLGEVGVTRIGHLLALPRASLASRFDGFVLRRLLQALGEAQEHIDPVRPDPPPRAELIFDGPTDHWESVESAAHQVVSDLVAQLARREQGVRRLYLELLRPCAPPSQARIDLSRPSRADKHLWSLVRSRLEHMDLGEGVDGIVLTAVRTARLRHQQQAAFSLDATGDSVPEGAWGELIDTLTTRLAPENVVILEPVESHLPERAFRERPAIEEPAHATPARLTIAERPTLLYPRPEPADAMALTPDGPLLSLGWRGRRWQVISCIGPERIGQEWWRWSPPASQAMRRSPPPPPPDRDYFAIQTDCGKWLWVFRRLGAGGWFVHGEWS